MYNAGYVPWPYGIEGPKTRL